MRSRNNVKRNSVKEIISYLQLTGPVSEGKIMRDVFGYNRNTTWESNKKYTDMLRRALSKGTIDRFQCSSIPGVQSRYFYFIGNLDEVNPVMLWNFIYNNE